MKQLTISLPDSQVEKLAEKLTELVTGLGGTVQATNKDLFDTNIPIWERIETVEDAVAYTEIALPDNIEELPLDIQAYLKLRVVCAAYNELKADELDKFPKFTTDEYRYYPWFLLYTQEEIDRMDEEEKSRVLGRSGSNANANAGVGFRTRIAPPRARTRTAAVGSASKRKSWLRSAESVSSNFGRNSLRSSKKRTEQISGNSPLISSDFLRRKKSSGGQTITPPEDLLCK